MSLGSFKTLDSSSSHMQREHQVYEHMFGQASRNTFFLRAKERQGDVNLMRKLHSVLSAALHRACGAI